MRQPFQLVTKDKDDAPSQDEHRTLELSDGQTVHLEISKHRDGVTLDSQGAPLTLTITMGPTGPEVSINRANLTIASTDSLSLEAEHLELKGRKTCTVETNGDAKVQAGGTLRLESADDCIVKADVIHLN